MVAIVTGAGTGLLQASGDLLGGKGQLGISTLGQNGEDVAINAANGNLLVQSTDAMLFGTGLNAVVVDTYNSQLGAVNGVVGATGSGWWESFQRTVVTPVGFTSNGSTSSVTYVAADGSELVYTWNATTSAYVGTNQGDGAYDSLSYNTTSSAWTWTDGDTQQSDIFDATHNNRLEESLDASGNALTYLYNSNGQLTSITTEGGEYLSLTYNGSSSTSLLASIATEYYANGSGGTLSTMSDVSYAYGTGSNNPNELASTTVSLGGSATYVTSYTYNTSASDLIKTISQTDGSKLTLAYSGTAVSSFTQNVASGVSATTSLTYSAGKTIVTDPLSNTATLSFNTATSTGSLDTLTGLTISSGGTSSSTSYVWDGKYDLLSATDADGSTAVYTYDSSGDVTKEVDGAGDVISSTYNTSNGLAQLLTQTTYPTSSTGNTVRYAYDSKGRLAFEVSAAGDVTQYIYNSSGEQISQIQYAGNLYNLSGISSSTSIASSTLSSWVVSSATLSASQRTDYTYDVRGDIESETTYTFTTSSGTGAVDWSHVRETLNTAYLPNGELLSRVLVTPVASGTSGATSATLYTYTASNTLSSSTISATLTSESYVYDGMGRLISSVDEDGETTSTAWSYTTSGSTETVTIPDGGTDTSTFNLAGELVTYVVSGSSVSAVTHDVYDSDGRLAYSVDPTGQVTGYVYNAGGEVVATTQYAVADTTTSTWASYSSMSSWATSNATGALIADKVYDADGRLTFSISPAGAVTAYAYNNDGQVISTTQYATTDAPSSSAPALSTMTAWATSHSTTSDRTTHSVYDGAGELAYVVDGGGSVTGYQYNADGQVTKTTDFATSDSTASTWSSYANMTAWASSNSAGALSATNAYDATGELISSVDGAGAITSYTYDAAGEVTETTRFVSSGATSNNRVTNAVYDALGRTAYTVNGVGAVTGFVYDGDSHVVQETMFATLNTSAISGTTLSAMQAWATSNSSNASNEVTNEVYNTAGQLAYAIAADGSVTGYVYDAAGDVLTTTQYATLNTSAISGTTLSAMNTWAASSSGGVNTANRITHDVYDNDWRLAYSVDPVGAVTGNVYDAQGHLVQQTQYVTLDTTTSTWASLSAMNTWAGSNSGNAANQVTDYVYSGGRLAYSLDPTGAVTGYTYDTFGAAVQTVAYATQDVLSAGVSAPSYATMSSWATSNAGAHDEIMGGVFDADGRGIYAIDAGGFVTANQFNALGELTTTTSTWTSSGGYSQTEGTAATVSAISSFLSSNSGSSKNETTSYTYDADARVLTTTDPTGAVTSNQFNAFGNVVTTSDGNGNTTHFVYDASGALVYAVDADGFVTATGRDFDGQITSVTRYATSDTTSTTWASVSAMQSWVTSNANSSLDDTTTMTRDARERVLTTSDAQAVAGAGNGDVTSFSFDAFGDQITIANGLSGVTSQVFNGQGLMTSQILPESSILPYSGGVATGQVQATSVTNTWTYDAFGNMLTTVQASGLAEQLTTSYTYDEDGRQVSTIGQSMTVTSGGTLSTSTVTPTATKVYDAFGNLIVSKDATGAETFYYYNTKNQKIAEVDADGNTTTWTFDGFGNWLTQTQYAAQENPSFSTTSFWTNSAVDSGMSATAPAVVTDGGFSVLSRTTSATPPASWGMDIGGASSMIQVTSGDTVSASAEVAATNAANVDLYIEWFNASGTLISSTEIASATAGGSFSSNGSTPILLGGTATAITSAAFATLMVRGVTGSSAPSGAMTLQMAAPLIVDAADAGRTVQYAYDLDNRMTSSTVDNIVYGTFSGSAWSSTSGSITSSTVYDADGNAIQQTDVNGDVTYTYYDGDNRKIAEVDATSHLATWTYDAEGQPLTETQYAAALTGSVTTGTVPTAPLPAGDPNFTNITSNWNNTSTSGTGSARTPTSSTVGGVSWLTRATSGTVSSGFAMDVGATGSGRVAVSGGVEISLDTFVATNATSATLWIDWYNASGTLISAQQVAATSGGGTTASGLAGAIYLGGYAIAPTSATSAAIMVQAATASGVSGMSLSIAQPAITLTPDRVSSYVYDHDGRVTAQTLDNAGADTVTSSGALLQSGGNATVSYTYNALGDVLTETQATGDVTSYGYDLQGRRTSEIDATYQGYNDTSTTSITPETITAYNGLNEVTRVIVGQSGSISSTDLQLINSESERIAAYVYSGGLLLDQIDPDGNVTAYGYDADGRITAETFGAAIVGTSGAGSGAATFTSSGTPSFSSGVLQPGGGFNEWADFTIYDGAGHILSQGVASGSGSSYTTGDYSNYAYDAFGEITSEGTDGSNSEDFFYDNAGRVWMTNSAGGSWQVYAYDAVGNHTLTLAPADGISSSLSAYATPSSGAASLITALDAVAGVSSGNVSLTTTSPSHISGVVDTFDVYNRDNEQTETIEPLRVYSGTVSSAYPWETVTPMSGATLSMTSGYDAFGDVTSTTDANGNTTSYIYNVRGEQIEMIDPQVAVVSGNGSTTSASPTLETYYDVAGRQIATTDADGNTTTELLLTGTGYGSGSASVVSQFNPDGGAVVNQYDVFGDKRFMSTLEQITSTFSGLAYAWTVEAYVYDGGNELVEDVHPSDGVFDSSTGLYDSGSSLVDYYAYDGLGERIAATNNEEMRLVSSGMSLSSGTLSASLATLVGAASATTPSAVISAFDYVLAHVSSGSQVNGFDDEGRVASSTDYLGNTSTYAYVWSSGDVTSGLGTYGGWTETISAPYGSETNIADYFGNTISHTNFGGQSYVYTYLPTAQVGTQSNTATFSGVPDQALTFSYYNTGETEEVIDSAPSAGLTSQTSSGSQPASEYYGDTTVYAYDGNGNQTTENTTDEWVYFTSSGGHWTNFVSGQFNLSSVVANSATASYDALNRLTSAGWSDGTTIAYGYDAQGNTIEMQAAYKAIGSSASSTQSYWYAYDAMNRMTVTEGVVSGGQVVAGSGGAALIYDVGGQRIEDDFTTSASGSEEEYYYYGGDNYLDDIYISLTALNGSAYFYLAESDTRDAMGRITLVVDNDKFGAATGSKAYTYDLDSNLATEIDIAFLSAGSFTTATTSDSYDALSGTISTGGYTGAYQGGNVTDQRTTLISGTHTTISDDSYQYVWTDAALETGIVFTSNTSHWNSSFDTTLKYDANDHVQSAIVGGTKSSTLAYITNYEGEIVSSTETIGATSAGPQEKYYTFAGVVRGQVGNDGTPPSQEDVRQFIDQNATNSSFNGWTYGSAVAYANFDQNYSPINPASPGLANASGDYTAAAGDTLDSIAQALWGDASLWYLIADDNGLSGDQGLVSGQVLTIPAYVTNINNSSTTTSVYNQTQTLGNIQPDQIAPPPKHQGCSVEQIFIAIIAAALTVVTSGFIGPIAAPFESVIDNVYTQGIELATHMESKFSWQSLGTAALEGLGGPVLGQAIAVATGLQKKFDWTLVAVEAVEIGIQVGLGNELTKAKVDAVSTMLVTQTTAGLAGAAVRSLATGENFGEAASQELANTLGQSVGTAIGRTVGEAISTQLMQPQQSDNTGSNDTGSDDTADYETGRNAYNNVLRSRQLMYQQVQQNGGTANPLPDPTNSIIEAAFDTSAYEEQTGLYFVGTSQINGNAVYAYDDTSMPDGPDGSTHVGEIVVSASQQPSILAQYKDPPGTSPTPTRPPVRWKNLNAANVPLFPPGDLGRVQIERFLAESNAPLSKVQQSIYFKNSILTSEDAGKADLPVAIEAIQGLLSEKLAIANLQQQLSPSFGDVDDLILKYYHDDSIATLQTILLEANLISAKLNAGITYGVDPLMPESGSTFPGSESHTTIGNGFFNFNDAEREITIIHETGHMLGIGLNNFGWFSNGGQSMTAPLSDTEVYDTDANSKLLNLTTSQALNNADSIANLIYYLARLKR